MWKPWSRRPGARLARRRNTTCSTTQGPATETCSIYPADAQGPRRRARHRSATPAARPRSPVTRKSVAPGGRPSRCPHTDGGTVRSQREGRADGFEQAGAPFITKGDGKAEEEVATVEAQACHAAAALESPEAKRGYHDARTRQPQAPSGSTPVPAKISGTHTDLTRFGGISTFRLLACAL